MAKKLIAPDGSPVLYQGKEIFTGLSLGLVKEVNLDKRSMVMTGTDETKDRDGDIIRLSGWDLENYKKNPVFLWSHNYGSVPLSRAEKIIKRREPARMDFHLQWPTKGIYSFADMILELYAEKIINASSVGFIPFKWNPLPEEEKTDENPHNAYGREYLKQELLELSGCAVPSNPNALQNALKGFTEAKKFDFSFENLMKWVAGGTVIPLPEKADDIREEIAKAKTEIIDETTPLQVQVPDTVVPTLPPKEEKKEEVLTKEDEIIENDLALKPYPNEHACRLEDPGKFDRFARQNCKVKHDGKCIDYIFGIKEGKTSLQAMRYKKDVWTVGAAKSHCSSHNGSFEAASSSEVTPEEIKSSVEEIKVDVKDIKEIKSKLDEISQAFKSMAESNRESRISPAKTIDKDPMETPVKDGGAASVILGDAFVSGSKKVALFNQNSLKELVEAVKELKTKLGK
jgi:hypothetical protein